MAVDTEEDIGAQFAAMMSGAAAEAGEENGGYQSKRPREDATDDAPYGYKADGTPRRSNGGRPRKSPSVDELKARREERATESDSAPEDREPDDKKRGKILSFGKKDKEEDKRPVPQYHEGQIARGVNKLYRKAGKIIRAWDAEIGAAVIEATKKEDADDVTVGEAWEELARTNVRIRRFWLKMIQGGAWGGVFLAHAPILMAVVMKDGVRKYIPFMGIIESMAEPDDDTPAGEGGLPGGMTADDVKEASRLAQEQMAKMGFSVSPEMAKMAEGMFGGRVTGPADTGAPDSGGSRVPPVFNRQQPKRSTRAQRAGHR